ncbi:Kynurenine--oxoglutarate transaminase 3, partial [Tyrophagus putrescentiae]
SNHGLISSSSTTSQKKLAASRLDGMSESVWVEFIQLALDYKPVNLGQGFPDFPAPESVRLALADAATGANQTALNQYTRGFGHPRLVGALAALYSKLTGHPLDPKKEVMVTTGAYQALYSAFMALVEQGDEVIIIEPFFDCYEPMVRMAGATPVFIPLRPRAGLQGSISSKDWLLDMAELEAKFSPRTKVIIINTPHNPLGKIFSRDELTAIGDLCQKYDVIALMDEVYEWIAYPGAEHVRMATLPGMWERTITIGSAGKTFSVTGWKIGWAYGAERLMRPLMMLHQNCVYTCNTPAQEAIAVGFEAEVPKLFSGDPDCYWRELVRLLEPKRDRMVRFLAEVDMAPTVPEGGYFMVADFSRLAEKVDLSGEKDTAKDYRFRQKLQGIPMSAFYSAEHKSIAENLIRFCFIKTDETLSAAEAILSELKKSL